MQWAQLYRGRVFLLRLTDGEDVGGSIESFCAEHGVGVASVSVTGAVMEGSVIVCGPRVPIEGRVEPITLGLEDYWEVTGHGTVVPDEEGTPRVHLHGSVGRDGRSVTGDLRILKAWLVVEVLIEELLGHGPVRLADDPRLDGRLLEIRRWPPRKS